MRAGPIDRRFPPLCGTPLHAFPHFFKLAELARLKQFVLTIQWLQDFLANFRPFPDNSDQIEATVSPRLFSAMNMKFWLPKFSPVPP